MLPDDVGGGAAAGAHLLGTGRRHVAHIAGPERFLAARLRAQGLRGALATADVPLAAGEVLYGEWSERWGREAAGLLLRRAPETDAIFCGSDQIARGAGDALRAAGRRVPDDIAIVGFDNWEPMVLGADPPLSSVDMCLEDIGRAAAEDLLAAIGGSRPGACAPCPPGSWSAPPAPLLPGRRAAHPLPPAQATRIATRRARRPPRACRLRRLQAPHRKITHAP